MRSILFRVIVVLSLVVLGIGLLSCTSGSKLDVVHDEYGGVQIIATTGIRLVADNTAPTEYVDLNILRVTKQDGQKNYRLVAEYLGNEWLLIQQGQSLIVHVDGQTMTLSRETGVDQKKVIERKRVLEVATYPLMRKQLEQIASALEVTVTLKGAERSVSRKFIWDTFEKYQEFVNTY